MSKTIYNEHRYTEGYMNPTAGQAIENIEREARRKQKDRKAPANRQKGKNHDHQLKE